MTAVATKEKDYSEVIAREVGECCDDPLQFVKLVFDWGHGDLEGHTGPDEWQAELLTAIGDWCRNGDNEALQSATASGHGIGKGAVSA